MRVYIMLPGEEKRQAAEVTAVTENGLDLKTEDGATVIGWRGAVYDKDENEISPERIKRDFVAADIAALRARIEALEAMMTEN